MMADAPLDLRAALAADLLRIGAVVLRPEAPFTWASGLRAPIYCDNRTTLAFPDVRRHIRDGFAALAAHHGLRPDLIAGTATAGIPHAAWLADALELPMCYVRAKPKEHGRGNQIEGRVLPGQRVLLVEDLVSTGGSALAAALALRDAGADVVACLAIFTYGFARAERAFHDANVPLHALTDYDALVGAASLSPETQATLRAWREDPDAWSAEWGVRNAE